MQKQELYRKFCNDEETINKIVKEIVPDKNNITVDYVKNYYMKALVAFYYYEISYEDSVLLITSVLTNATILNKIYSADSMLAELKDFVTAMRVDNPKMMEAKKIIEKFNKMICNKGTEYANLIEVVSRKEGLNFIVDYIYERMPEAMTTENRIESVIDFISVSTVHQKREI